MKPFSLPRGHPAQPVYVPTLQSYQVESYKFCGQKTTPQLEIVPGTLLSSEQSRRPIAMSRRTVAGRGGEEPAM